MRHQTIHLALALALLGLLLLGAAAAQEAIEVDQTLTGALAEGDTLTAQGCFQDEYRLEAVAGQTLTIHNHSDEFDGVLTVIDASGDIHENDDFESTRDSQVTLEVAEAGPVQIRVRSFFPGAEGEYVLSISRAGDETSGLRGAARQAGIPISVGQSVQGYLEAGDQRLTSGEWADFFLFEGVAGTEVTIDMGSSQVDPYIILVHPSGQQTENDDAVSGQDFNAQLSGPLPETGLYTLVATTFQSGEVGGYELSINPGAVPAPPPGPPPSTPAIPVSLGESVSGHLGDGDATRSSGTWVDEFTFQATAGQRIEIRLLSDAFDPVLLVTLPNGTERMSDDALGTLNPQILAQFMANGECRIQATSYRPGESGDYALLIKPLDAVATPTPTPTPGGTPLAANQAMGGELSASDRRLGGGEYIAEWVFEGEAGQAVAIDMASTAIDSYLILWSPSGEQEDNDDSIPGETRDARIALRLPETGTYRIGCTSYQANEVGPYSIGLAVGVDNIEPLIQVSPGREYYGIFCGIRNYPTANDLDLCDSDAIKLAQAFIQMGLMGPDQAITLIDAQATSAGIDRAFAQLAPRIDSDDVFIFFYSGHGGQGRPSDLTGEADLVDEYILTHDEVQFTDDHMAELFDTINAEIAVLCLDACFSGGFAKDVIVQPHRMGLFSSEEDLTSAVADKFQAGGYLSHFFLQAVQGEADFDPPDSAVTVGELCQFLQVSFARNVIESVGAETTQGHAGYQHLVIDRGGVKIQDILIQQ